MQLKFYFLFSIFILLNHLSIFAQQHNMMPVPHSISWGSGQFRLDSAFCVVVKDSQGDRVPKAVNRFLQRLDNRAHLFIAKEPLPTESKPSISALAIKYIRNGKLTLGEDETYKISVAENRITLEAETDFGVMHGLETLLQLINFDENGFYIPVVTIEDKPRFPWRGLLIDVCRHFSPVDVIKRNLDGMAMLKMNVLHLHLSEDQGFRIESKVFPKLHLLGSNGEYYTQEQMKDIIRYASDRGIRVVPEFDMPGHATSWMVGYPELASAPGPYEIEKKFGVFDPTMDPTKQSTYKFLEKFIAEMAALFPDEHFHIGGDENNGKQWDQNKSIQDFMKKNNIKDNHELQNHFNNKVLAIVQKNKKKMVGWDEILQPGLPTDAVIQSWRGKEGLKQAARKGYNVILSNGYYIDLCQPAAKHYMNDPFPNDADLTPAEELFILGGEATMWAELVTHETIDSRIWPRTAAIAERLWSKREVNNIRDMYRRLEIISLQLEEIGLQHIRNQDMMIRRITGTSDISPLKTLVAVVEPLKDYSRHSQGIAYSTDLPFTRIPDIAFPESKTAREFQWLCEALVKKRDASVEKQIEMYLNLWISNHDDVMQLTESNVNLSGWKDLSLSLKNASLVALESLNLMNRRQSVTDEWTTISQKVLLDSKKPIHESELAVIDAITMIFHHALHK